jgi:hypothetical protein
MDLPHYDCCDYLCEQCSETASCSIYHRLKAGGPQTEFFHGIDELLHETKALLCEMASELETEGETSDPLDSVQELLRRDPLVVRAHLFTVKSHRFLQRAEMRVTGEGAKWLSDLTWYHTLVAVKTLRAVYSLYDGFDEGAVSSARVARKAIQKCVRALTSMGGTYPDLTEECKILTASARSLRRALDRYIPA